MSYPQYQAEDPQSRTQQFAPQPIPQPAPPQGPPPAALYPAPPQFAVAPVTSPVVGYGPPPAKRPVAAIVLSIVTVLLVVFGGVMVGFYLDKRGELRETKADLTSQVQAQEKIVADQGKKIADGDKKAADLNSQLTGTKNNLAGVTSDRNALVPCMRRIQEAFTAAENGDAGATRTALRRAKSSCDKAEGAMDD
ncbi:MAG: hypothetical protein ABW000_05035 [Actinoplanes sp.]